MKKTLMTVAAGTVALTCLAWAQPPQGAKETVVIKKEAAAPKAPAEKLQSPGSTPKPQVTRDPFVNGPVSAPPPTATLKPKQDNKPAANADGGKTATNQTAEQKTVEIIAPDVTVKGLLLSRTGNRAIVQGPKMTFIVKAGDKLGDYRVASITKNQVVFSYKDKKFPIKLEDEFGAKQ